jgi:succinate dehydrogenase hydrophobic anchor subunit
VNEAQEKQKNTDEMVQLVTGVLLIAFAVVAVAVLLAVRVADILAHPY